MKKIKKLIVLASINTIFILIVMSNFPQEVALHIGLNNQIDQIESKYFLLLLCVIPLLLTIGMGFYRKKTIRNDKINRNQDIEDLFFSIFTVLMIYISWIEIAVAMGHARTGNLEVQVKMQYVIGIPLGLMIIIFSNYMGTIKQNRYLGIKIRPTLENEQVWKKTHRLGGFVGVIVGMLIIILAIISGIMEMDYLFFIGVTIAIAILVIIPTVYAHYISKKNNVYK